jgi:hypothetical protein
MTLYIGGRSRLVTFPTAPVAIGRSDRCRKGLAPSRESRTQTSLTTRTPLFEAGRVHILDFRKVQYLCVEI